MMWWIKAAAIVVSVSLVTVGIAASIIQRSPAYFLVFSPMYAIAGFWLWRMLK